MAPMPRELDQAPTGLLRSLRKNFLTTIGLVVVSVLLASVLMSGWPEGLIPKLAVPYIFQGDGLSHAWLIQRTIESPWYFVNNRSGYPFGSSFLDYPSSDFGNFAFIKLFGWIFGNWYATLNVFFLAGFVLTTAITFGVLLSFRVNRFHAMCGAIIFAFLPYHFLRLAHLFYTWYFVVPIYFYYAYKLFYIPNYENLTSLLKKRRNFLHAGALIVCSCFGVYFAFFGCLVLICAGFVAAVQQRRISVFFLGFSCALMVAIGVGINVSPNVAYTEANGINTSVAVRSPGESEIYGLKIDQMLLPRENHRIAQFAAITAGYEKSFPLVNENSTATLGLFGAIGLLGLTVLTFASLAGVRLKKVFALLTGVTIFLILVATVGGFSSLFAIFVSASIRGWNRISVFIAFSSIAFCIICIDHLLKKIDKPVIVVGAGVLVAIVSALAVMDQTTAACRACNIARAEHFREQKTFFANVEDILPRGSAVYQLPYISFPEVPDVHGVSSYDQLEGFLFTKSLKWSHGGMMGRAGDNFFRILSGMTLPDQITVARALGFAGLTMNLEGYADEGKGEEKILTSLVGEPAIKNAQGNIIFYRLHDISPQIVKGSKSMTVYRLADDALRKGGATSTEPHFDSDGKSDFSQRYLPLIRELRGLSGIEPWGRWSDARLDDHVSIIYKANLPTHLRLTITALAYGPNVGIPVRVTIGHSTKTLIFGSAMSTKTLSFITNGVSNIINIYPPRPVSPGADPRIIGIGIRAIQIQSN